MTEKQKILVVVDPAHEEHLALERAVVVCETRTSKPELLIHIAHDQSDKGDTADSGATYAAAEDLMSLTKPFDELGIDYRVELCWSAEWQVSIAERAKTWGAGTVIVPANKGGRHRWRLGDPHWALIRQSVCPVLVVRNDPKEPRKVVLAAVLPSEGDERRKALNEQILKRGNMMANDHGAQLHVVSAYPNSENFPDRRILLEETGVPQEQLHVHAGEPAEVIKDVADNIEADVVIIGAAKRTGVLAAMRGRVAEKVLDRVSLDVIAVN